VTARVDIPVFDNSAMDGFAVLFDDVAAASPDAPVTLTVVADLPAGTDLDPPLGPGEAARIMTGSPTPTDATAVVPFEDTLGGLADSLGRITVVRAPRPPGVHIRRRGGDVVAGDELLQAGTVIGALQAAAAAAAGVAEVIVTRLPRVAVVSTGSELVSPGTPLRRGQIPESNSELLAGLALEAGVEVVFRTTVSDDGDGPPHAIAEAETLGADAVIFSGGVSAGAFEVVKTTLADRMTFTKVRMQPGKPQGFGVTDAGMLLFGLPGNPVSAAVSFEVFVRPALRAALGHPHPERPRVTAALAAPLTSTPGRRQFRRGVLDAVTGTVRETGGPPSHLLAALARADCFFVVPEEVTELPAGASVEVWLLDNVL
jgi:molybdopterin molybdotransferase